MRMPSLLILKLGALALLVGMLWISGCDSKAGAQAAKAKSAPATCPMAKTDTTSCPALKEDSACCGGTACTDEQKAACPAEMTCPMQESSAAQPAVDIVANTVEQKTCPVMGNPINKEIFTDYKGKKVYFCCAGCKPEFEKNPEKYLDKLPQFK